MTDVRFWNQHLASELSACLSVCVPHLERVSLCAQALGAELHDRVGTEGVSDLVLAQGAQPQR